MDSQGSGQREAQVKTKELGCGSQHRLRQHPRRSGLQPASASCTSPHAQDPDNRGGPARHLETQCRSTTPTTALDGRALTHMGSLPPPPLWPLTCSPPPPTATALTPAAGQPHTCSDCHASRKEAPGPTPGLTHLQQSLRVGLARSPRRRPSPPAAAPGRPAPGPAWPRPLQTGPAPVGPTLAPAAGPCAPPPGPHPRPGPAAPAAAARPAPPSAPRSPSGLGRQHRPKSPGPPGSPAQTAAATWLRPRGGRRSGELGVQLRPGPLSNRRPRTAPSSAPTP